MCHYFCPLPSLGWCQLDLPRAVPWHLGRSHSSFAAHYRHPHKLQFLLAKDGNKCKYNTLPCGPSWKSEAPSGFKKPAGKNQEVQPKGTPCTQVVTHRPKIIISTVQAEQAPKAASPQVSGGILGKSLAEQILLCQSLVTAVNPLHRPHEYKGHPNTFS